MTQRGNTRDGDQRVVITDLGIAPDQVFTPLPESAQHAPRSLRIGRFLLTGVSVIALLLLAADADTPRGEEVADTAGFAATCEEIQQASQQESSPTDAWLGPAIQTGPLVMSLSQIDPTTGREIAIAQVNADNLWIFCASPAELVSLGEPGYPGEEPLGDLPDGMAYVYRQDRTAMTYSVAGVRLRDGSIVEDVTLGDGRTLPITPATAPQHSRSSQHPLS